MTPAWSPSTGFFNTMLKFTIIIMFCFTQSTNCYKCNPKCQGRDTYCQWMANTDGPKCYLCRMEGTGCGRTGIPCCPGLRCSYGMKCEKYEGRKAGQSCDSYNYCVAGLSCIFHKCGDKVICQYPKLGEFCDPHNGICCNAKAGHVCSKDKCRGYLKPGDACSKEITERQFMICPILEGVRCMNGACTEKSERLARAYKSFSAHVASRCPCEYI